MKEEEENYTSRIGKVIEWLVKHWENYYAIYRNTLDKLEE